ncbi:MAG: toxin-activating lysine-acyltransferase [Rhodoferax sp.]|nr:toxin-activating lysine-acyltransferase [Rhodoferax sp.]
MTEAETQKFLELAGEQAKRVVSKVPLLGAVAWLMMQQAGMRHTLLSELDWRVMPPLLLDQAKLYMKESTPIAYVSWANLSDEVAQRYCMAPHHLTASDWQSGDQLWVIDFVVPFGGAAEIMNELRKTKFAGQAIHQLVPESAGKTKPMTWPALAHD